LDRRKELEKSRATDACKIPPGLPHRSWIAGTMSKLKKPDELHDTSTIDLGIFISLCLIFLLFVTLWTLPYSFGASAQMTEGADINWSNGYDISTAPHLGTTDTLLLNSTPFNGSEMWEEGINPYTLANSYSNADGYYVSISGPSINSIPNAVAFSRTTYVTLPEIDQLFFNVLLDVLEGTGEVTLIVEFTDKGPEVGWVQLFERSVTSELQSGGSINLTLSIPLALLRTISLDWMSEAHVNILITGTPTARVLIKQATARAISHVPLFPLTIDAVASTGESLYSSSFTKFLSNRPVILLNRTGGYGSPALFLRSSNCTVFLPQDHYSSVIGWYNYYIDNPVIDPQEVVFDVLADERIDLRLELRTLRLDIVSTLPIPFDRMDIRFESMHSILTVDSWGGLFTLPDRLYLPPLEAEIWIGISFDQGMLETSASLSLGHTHELSLFFPLAINAFGFLLNLGQILAMGLVILILLLLLKRWLVKSAGVDRQALIYDSRFFPLLLLVLSFFFPWLTATGNLGFYAEGYHTSSYFLAIPVSIESVQGSASVIVVSFASWYFIGAAVLLLSWAPLIKLFFMLPNPASHTQNRTTAKLLLLPMICSILCLIIAILSGLSLGLGAFLAMTGLPLWLLLKLGRGEIAIPRHFIRKRKQEGAT